MDHTPDQSEASHHTDGKAAFGLPDVRDRRGDAFPPGPRSRRSRAPFELTTQPARRCRARRPPRCRGCGRSFRALYDRASAEPRAAGRPLPLTPRRIVWSPRNSAIRLRHAGRPRRPPPLDRLIPRPGRLRARPRRKRAKGQNPGLASFTQLPWLRGRNRSRYANLGPASLPLVTVPPLDSAEMPRICAGVARVASVSALIATRPAVPPAGKTCFPRSAQTTAIPGPPPGHP